MRLLGEQKPATERGLLLPGGEHGDVRRRRTTLCSACGRRRGSDTRGYGSRRPSRIGDRRPAAGAVHATDFIDGDFVDAHSLFCLLPLLIASSFQTVLSTTFTVTNNCGYEVWPGVLSNAGSAALDSTGFALAPGESRALAAPVPWSGRLWARTLCSADSSSGRFFCGTGDCGTGVVSCGGAGAAPPATLVEFTLGGAGATDFYDVSLVDGFNLPVLVGPLGGAGAGCAATWCAADVNAVCPPELRVAAAGIPAAACKSACMAFGTARYCCSGEFSSPAACGPTPYSELFKSECPRAYSYAYDDASSTFTCPTAAAAAAGGYAVTFCPETTSLVPKGGDQNPEAAGSPSANGTMAFFGSANLAAGDVPYLLHQFWGVFALVIYLFYR